MVRVAQNPQPYFAVPRLPHPGGPGSRIYIPQEQGGPVIPTGTGFPLRRLLRLPGLRWRYSNPPPNLEGQVRVYISPRNKMVQSKVMLRSTVSPSVCLGFESTRLYRGCIWTNFKLTLGGVHSGEIFNVTIRRAACEACSPTWNLGTDSAFALGPRKTTENLDRVGRSQNLPDANWLLVSNLALNTRVLTLDPICAVFFPSFENIYKLFLQKILLHIIWIRTKPRITPAEGMNAYMHNYAYK
jgi:hypothetical protein